MADRERDYRRQHRRREIASRSVAPLFKTFKLFNRYAPFKSFARASGIERCKENFSPAGAGSQTRIHCMGTSRAYETHRRASSSTIRTGCRRYGPAYHSRSRRVQSSWSRISSSARLSWTVCSFKSNSARRTSFSSTPYLLMNCPYPYEVPRSFMAMFRNFTIFLLLIYTQTVARPRKPRTGPGHR